MISDNFLSFCLGIFTPTPRHPTGPLGNTNLYITPELLKRQFYPRCNNFTNNIFLQITSQKCFSFLPPPPKYRLGCHSCLYSSYFLVKVNQTYSIIGVHENIFFPNDLPLTCFKASLDLLINDLKITKPTLFKNTNSKKNI